MLNLNTYGQTTYPVQVYTQLTPPYTSYLPAYYSGVNQKLKVTLINTDMAQSELSVYLRMRIQSSSFTIETPENVYTERISLQAGVPLQLSLNDLATYFKNENMRISGGRNEFLRTNTLPDNFYRFNFEVYEATTGRLLSNPKLGFVQAMIASGEPPILNMPLKGTTIMEANIPSIMFSWTPRHMNSMASAYGTEYEFTLVEIFDKQVAPEAAFNYSRVLYTETVRSTSFVHTVAQPMLVPGMRYAWRVRAVAREGIEEANVFKNNGYSPISWFDYTVDCKLVQYDKVEVKDRVATISWQKTDAIDYDVQYRKKGSNKWYEGSLKDHETCPVYNLKFGEEYEYKIGVRCTMNDPFAYTDVKGFRMPEELAKNSNCGILPNINVSNQTPTRELQAKLPILVGDFPVFVTKVSGSGKFTGEGYVGIPYLKNAKIAVTFKDITVNTDNRMIAGYMETKYDVSASGNNLLWDVDETLTGGKGVGDIRTGEEKAQYVVDYTIDPNVTGKYKYIDSSEDEIKEGEDYETQKGENGYYVLTLTDKEGNEHEVKVDSLPTTIEDNEGNTYEVREDKTNKEQCEMYKVISNASVEQQVSLPLPQYIGYITEYGSDVYTANFCNSQNIEKADEILSAIKGRLTGYWHYKQACDVQVVKEVEIGWKRAVLDTTTVKIDGIRYATETFYLSFKNNRYNITSSNKLITIADLNNQIVNCRITMEDSISKSIKVISDFTLSPKVLQQPADSTYMMEVKRSIQGNPNRVDYYTNMQGIATNNDVSLRAGDQLEFSMALAILGSDTIVVSNDSTVWYINNKKVGAGMNFTHTITNDSKSVKAMLSTGDTLFIDLFPIAVDKDGRLELDYSNLTNPKDTVRSVNYFNTALPSFKDRNNPKKVLYGLLDIAPKKIVVKMFPTLVSSIPNSIQKGEAVITSSTNPQTYSLLELDSIKVDANGDILNARLISRINDMDEIDIDWAIRQGRSTQKVDRLLYRIERLSISNANHIRQIIASKDTTQMSFLNSVRYEVTAADDISEWIEFNTGNTIDINMNMSAFSSQSEFTKTTAHELLHIYWSVFYPFEKLKWIIIRDKVGTGSNYNYTLGDTLGNNSPIGEDCGCSTGPAHERNNPENKEICVGEKNY